MARSHNSRYTIPADFLHQKQYGPKLETDQHVGLDGFEPSTNRLCFSLLLSQLFRFVSWTIPSPHERGACRLVSTPSSNIRGLARDCPAIEGFNRLDFPEFDKLSFKNCSLNSPACPYKSCYHSVMNKSITCVVCARLLSGKQSLYCSVFCKNQVHQSYAAQQERGWARKKELVERMGGECSACGYKKNLSALAFHHADPEQKNFQLDIRSLSNRRSSQIEREIRKCTLLCNNCHAELHNPKHNL